MPHVLKCFFQLIEDMCLHVQEEESGHAADSQKALASTSETMMEASCMTCRGRYGKTFVTINLRQRAVYFNSVSFR